MENKGAVKMVWHSLEYWLWDPCGYSLKHLPKQGFLYIRLSCTLPKSLVNCNLVHGCVNIKWQNCPCFLRLKNCSFLFSGHHKLRRWIKCTVSSVGTNRPLWWRTDFWRNEWKFSFWINNACGRRLGHIDLHKGIRY